MTWRHCRCCDEVADAETLIKYGVRACAHPKCFLRKHGVAGLDRLTLHGLESFPVLALRGHVADPVAFLGNAIENRKARMVARRSHA